MIEVKNISKSYGEKNQKILAVDNISFSVENGEIFGLIGPDGSGKTSIFRMLTTLIHPDSGSAEIEGLDVVKDYMKSTKDGKVIIEKLLDFLLAKDTR